MGEEGAVDDHPVTALAVVAADTVVADDAAAALAAEAATVAVAACTVDVPAPTEGDLAVTDGRSHVLTFVAVLT